ncbi:hypothetical protein VTJ04DRAFT_1147 [Mycothermus thermophilus]|uniref:uncharacterized protein n=1 Tax=Humicola insolens TaxID=85995 RepID=UPI0037428CDE
MDSRREPTISPWSWAQDCSFSFFHWTCTWMRILGAALAVLMLLEISSLGDRNSPFIRIAWMTTCLLTFIVAAEASCALKCMQHLRDLHDVQLQRLRRGFSRTNAFKSLRRSSSSSTTSSNSPLRTDYSSTTPSHLRSGSHRPATRTSQSLESNSSVGVSGLQQPTDDDSSPTMGSLLHPESNHPTPITSSQPHLRINHPSLMLLRPSLGSAHSLRVVEQLLAESDRSTTVSSQRAPSNPRSRSSVDLAHIGVHHSRFTSGYSGSDTSSDILLDRIITPPWNEHPLWNAVTMDFWRRGILPMRSHLSDTGTVNRAH